MNNLLIFFAFPIAVIIFSIVLQKLLHNPFAVAALIFAIFIVITFAAFDQDFLIATLVYTILSFITALLAYRLINSNNFCNQNIDSTTNLCSAITDTLEKNSNVNNSIDNTTCNTNSKSSETITNDDNVISNNCGYMYNRRCRRF